MKLLGRIGLLSIFLLSISVIAQEQSIQQLTYDWNLLIGPLGKLSSDRLADIKIQIDEKQPKPIVFDVFNDHGRKEMFHRNGYLLLRKDAVGTVLICHGYLGCKQDAIALQHLFPTLNVVAFDFRAHGQDTDGQYSTIGRDEALDVLGAVNFIKAHKVMQNKPIIAYGFSMGAVAAIQAQAMEGNLFDAMILDCPYDSTDEAMRRGLEEKMQITLFGKTITIPGKDFLIDHMYDDYLQSITNYLFEKITALDPNKVATKFVKVCPAESVKKITVPVFFIHCENDKKVPIKAVERLYENKPGYKRLWITQGKGHFGSYSFDPDRYWYKINKFLIKFLSPDGQDRVQERVCDERTVKNVPVVAE